LCFSYLFLLLRYYLSDIGRKAFCQYSTTRIAIRCRYVYMLTRFQCIRHVARQRFKIPTPRFPPSTPPGESSPTSTRYYQGARLPGVPFTSLCFPSLGNTHAPVRFLLRRLLVHKRSTSRLRSRPQAACRPHAIVDFICEFIKMLGFFDWNRTLRQGIA